MSNMVRWEPFRDIVSLREAMDRLLQESFVGPWGSMACPSERAIAAVDMYETDDAVVLEAALPGVNPDDLDISVAEDAITIRGEVKREMEVNEENFYRRERHYGSFCRSLPLPAAIAIEDAEAVFENGVLHLTLPKAEKVESKTIKIRTK